MSIRSSDLSDDQQTTILVTALELAEPICEDISTWPTDDTELTAVQVLAVAVGLMVERLERVSRQGVVLRCGWCWRAAGDTPEAWQSLPVMGLEEARAHAVACPHNPLVGAGAIRAMREIRHVVHEASMLAVGAREQNVMTHVKQLIDDALERLCPTSAPSG